VNAQTEETQETALTLACCGGFLEIAELLINSGANLELGCSTPLMEAAQEGHVELVKYLIAAGMLFVTIYSPILFQQTFVCLLHLDQRCCTGCRCFGLRNSESLVSVFLNMFPGLFHFIHVVVCCFSSSPVDCIVSCLTE